MNISLQKLVLWVFGVMFLFAVEVECANVKVRLFDLVLVSGEPACLGDLADLVGPDDTVNRLASTCVAISEGGNSAKVITQAEIASYAAEGTTLDFVGAPAVYVSASDEFCDAALLLPALQNRLNHLAGDSLTVSIKIKGTHSILRGAESPPVQFSFHDLDVIYPGEQVLTLIRSDSHGRVNRQHLKVKVTATAMLAFPVKTIKRGEAIEAGDIENRMTELKANRLQGLVMTPGRLEGLEATRMLSPGNPVRWDHVSLPPEVRKGDGVAVVLKADNFAIRATAEALQSGSAGDEIWVRLKNNGKRMRAVVLGPAQVAIH